MRKAYHLTDYLVAIALAMLLGIAITPCRAQGLRPGQLGPGAERFLHESFQCPHCGVELLEPLRTGEYCPNCQMLYQPSIEQPPRFKPTPMPPQPEPVTGKQVLDALVPIELQQKAVGAVLAVVFGLVMAGIAWAYREFNTQHAMVLEERDTTESMGRLLHSVGKGSGSSHAQASAPADRWPWLRAMGWRSVEVELAAALRRKRPHPFRRWSYILWPGLLTMAFGIGLSTIMIVVFALILPDGKPQYLMRGFVAGMVIVVSMAAAATVWQLAMSRRVRRQAWEAERAARQLGLEFANFQPLSPNTANHVFPLLSSGELTCAHVAMLGELNGTPLVAGFIRYTLHERTWAGPRDVTHNHFAIAFATYLPGVPDFLAVVGSGVYNIHGVPEDARRISAYLAAIHLEPGWTLLVSRGHLTIWRGDYFALLCKIVPGNRERIVAYVEQATQIGEEFLRMAVHCELA